MITATRPAPPVPATTPAKPKEKAKLPDLIVSDLEPSSFFPDNTVEFDIEVKNQGTAAATAFNVTLDDNRDTPLQTRVDEGLQPGKTARMHLGPIFMDPDTFQTDFTATADSDNEVEESDKSNNTRTITIFTPPPKPPTPIPTPPIPPIPHPPHA